MTLQSPGGEILFTVTAEPFQYSVKFRSQEIIQPSALDLEMLDSRPLQGLRLTSVRKSSVDKVSTPTWGKNGQVRNKYNELTLEFAERAQTTPQQAGQGRDRQGADGWALIEYLKSM